MKKYYLILIFLLLVISDFNIWYAADFFWTGKLENSWIIWTKEPLETSGNQIIWNFLNIMYFLITLYVFYWAFSIFTGAGDDEKVKSWKTIILHATAWFIIIVLFCSIDKFIFTAIIITTHVTL